MKVNKKTMNRFAAAALSVIASAGLMLSTAMSFTSCDSGFFNTADTNAADTEDVNTGLVTFAFNASDELRTASPDIASDDYTGITITYKSTSAAATTPATTLVTGMTYASLTAGTYKLPIGEYTFDATANVNEMTYTASVTKSIVGAGANPVNFVFSKTGVASTVAGTGYIDIDFTISDTTIKGVTAVLTKYSDESVKIAEKTLTITDGKCSYTIGEGSDIATSVDAGTYRLILEFYSDADCTVLVGNYCEIINVSDGLTSKEEYEISNAVKNLYRITYSLDEGSYADGVSTPPEYVTILSEYTLPTAAEMTKDEAIFRGWYLDADFTESKKVTELKDIKATTTLYAKWENKYITFKGNKAFTLGVNYNHKEWDGTVYYSTDKTDWNWEEWDGRSSISAQAASDGSYYIYLRGNNTAFATSYNQGARIISDMCTTLTLTGDDTTLEVECTGNIMTLLKYDDPDNAEMATCTFSHLFEECTALTTAPDLPATTLTESCYNCMFYDCTSLKKAPELPATTIAKTCYNYMFYGCSSLTAAPELPATTVADYCYQSMFSGCASLTSAPALPASNTAIFCYESMFMDCTSLTAAPVLQATTLMESCYASMFNSCTSLTTAPALPATTIAKSCYANMFEGCTALTSVPELNADTMFYMSYAFMFRGCTSLTAAPELPAMNLDENCYSGMFQGCTSMTSTPELPATTLADCCYYYMFQNCTGLTSISTISAQDFSGSESLYSMFSGCSSLKVEETSGSDYFISIPSSVDAGVLENMFENCASGCATAEAGKSYRVYLPYITFTGNEAFTLGLYIDHSTSQECGKYWDGVLEYSTDTTTWTTWATEDTTVSAAASNGKYCVYLRGQNTTFADFNDRTDFALTSPTGSNTLKVECTGNIMTLIDYTDADNASLSDYSFHELFKDCTVLTTAPTLPATTLKERCYWSIFEGCTSLVKAPSLPAETLADSCYFDMFKGCTSLTEAPELPADTMTVCCYYYMFEGCTSLAEAPELPSTTLAEDCYESMFAGCTSLTQPPELPATTLTEYCYQSMFSGCTSLTSAPSLPATTLQEYCYSYMFQNCTSLTATPELPATALTANCYNSMFYGCTGLTSIGKISATSVESMSLYAMFYGCSSLFIAKCDSDDENCFITINSNFEPYFEDMFTDCASGSATASGYTSYKVAKPITGTVSITGTAQAGQTLTAVYTPGAENETVTYQWYNTKRRVDDEGEYYFWPFEAISGATSSTYTLTTDDVEYKFMVKVTGSGSYAGTVESSDTDVVIAASAE